MIPTRQRKIPVPYNKNRCGGREGKPNRILQRMWKMSGYDGGYVGCAGMRKKATNSQSIANLKISYSNGEIKTMGCSDAEERYRIKSAAEKVISETRIDDKKASKTHIMRRRIGSC